MSKDTWNFQCHQTQDFGPDGGSRQTEGTLFEVETQPFSSEMTSIFSFLIRSGWTSQDDAKQGLFSIGVNSGIESVGYAFNKSGTTPLMLCSFKDGTAGTQRYSIGIGDEDGINWLQDDKWYQFVVSANASRIQYACNGSTSPKANINTDSPGFLNINTGFERIWMTSPPANTGSTDPISLATIWPSVVIGACVHYSTAIDLADSAVLGRIYDTDGNFKSPGENGSLWFGDTYGAVIPEYYFPTGVPYHNLGSDTQNWNTWDGGSPSTKTPIGGLRKQFE